MILTCDPSFTAFGWAVVDRNKIVDYGCIQAKSKEKKVTLRDNERLLEIGETLTDIIKKYNVKVIVTETVVGAKSYNAAKALNQCKGLMFGIATGTGIPLTLVSPKDSKLNALGDRNATKDQVSEYICRKYDINFEGKTKLLREAVCDALAVLESYEEKYSGIS